MIRIRREYPEALYPRTYVWLVFLAAMDIMMTTIIVFCGGREVNGVANWVLGHFDVTGLVFYKFAVLAFFLGVCEILGRRNRIAGRRLAGAAIAINFLPVALACALLFRQFVLPG
jgi:Domain of unknown function (DUF5658)